MKTCPYCMAEIHDEASKCQHCGEWVDGPPVEDEPVEAPVSRSRRGLLGRRGRRGLVDEIGGDQSLGRAANRYVSFTIVMAAVGLVVFLVILFAVILPNFRDTKKRIDGFPNMPGPVDIDDLRKRLPPR